MIPTSVLLLATIAAPMEALPEWAQNLIAFSPLRYYPDITYGVFLKGAGLDIISNSVLARPLLGGTTFGVGMWRFRRQFD